MPSAAWAAKPARSSAKVWLRSRPTASRWASRSSGTARTGTPPAPSPIRSTGGCGSTSTPSNRCTAPTGTGRSVCATIRWPTPRRYATTACTSPIRPSPTARTAIRRRRTGPARIWCGCPTSPANASRAASWATTSCASRISRARSVTRTRPAPPRGVATSTIRWRRTRSSIPVPSGCRRACSRRSISTHCRTAASIRRTCATCSWRGATFR